MSRSTPRWRDPNAGRVAESPRGGIRPSPSGADPPTPPNHRLIVGHNEAGSFPEGDPVELEAGANRFAVS